MVSLRAGALTLHGRVLGLLVMRDLKVRYASSVLGYLWTVLEPLMLAAVYYFVFTKIFSRGTVATDPYLVFLLAGLLPWQWANRTITESTRALSSESKLVRSTGIRREMWVLRVVGSKFVEFAFAVPVLVAFMLGYQKGIAWYAVIDVPLALLIEATLLLGVGLLLASLSVLYRDLVRIVRIVLRVLFYVSPIIYSAGDIGRGRAVTEAVGRLYAVNPFVGIMELYRRPLFPALFTGWVPVAQAAFVALVALAVGVWVFRRLEGTVLKEV